MFVGQGTEDASGHVANIDVIGGKYFTDMLDHQHGTLTANSALVVDQDSKIDILNVDNLTFDANTISTTNANGDIILNPGGSGEINIVDDTFLSFGSDKDAKIEYDENGNNEVVVTGANWNYSSVNVTINGTLNVTGNIDFDGDVNIDGGDLTTNQTSFNLLNTNATTINAFGTESYYNQYWCIWCHTTTLGSTQL